MRTIKRRRLYKKQRTKRKRRIQRGGADFEALKRDAGEKFETWLGGLGQRATEILQTIGDLSEAESKILGIPVPDAEREEFIKKTLRDLKLDLPEEDAASATKYFLQALVSADFAGPEILTRDPKSNRTLLGQENIPGWTVTLHENRDGNAIGWNCYKDPDATAENFHDLPLPADPDPVPWDKKNQRVKSGIGEGGELYRRIDPALDTLAPDLANINPQLNIFDRLQEIDKLYSKRVKEVAGAPGGDAAPAAADAAAAADVAAEALEKDFKQYRRRIELKPRVHSVLGRVDGALVLQESHPIFPSYETSLWQKNLWGKCRTSEEMYYEGDTIKRGETISLSNLKTYRSFTTGWMFGSGFGNITFYFDLDTESYKPGTFGDEKHLTGLRKKREKLKEDIQNEMVKAYTNQDDEFQEVADADARAATSAASTKKKKVEKIITKVSSFTMGDVPVERQPAPHRNLYIFEKLTERSQYLNQIYFIPKIKDLKKDKGVEKMVKMTNPLEGGVDIYLSGDYPKLPAAGDEPVYFFKWMCREIFKKRMHQNIYLDTLFDYIDKFLEITDANINDKTGYELKIYTSTLRRVFFPSCFEDEYLTCSDYKKRGNAGGNAGENDEELEGKIDPLNINQYRDVSFFRLKQEIIYKNYKNIFTHYMDHSIPFNLYFDASWRAPAPPEPEPAQAPAQSYVETFKGEVKSALLKCAQKLHESIDLVNSKYNYKLWQILSEVYPIYAVTEKNAPLKYRESLFAEEGTDNSWDLPPPSLLEGSNDKYYNYYINSLLTDESMELLLNFLFSGDYSVYKDGGAAAREGGEAGLTALRVRGTPDIKIYMKKSEETKNREDHIKTIERGNWFLGDSAGAGKGKGSLGISKVKYLSN